MRTIELVFLQAHSIWPKPRAFNPAQILIGTPKFYCVVSKILFYQIQLGSNCQHLHLGFWAVDMIDIDRQLIKSFLSHKNVYSGYYVVSSFHNIAQSKYISSSLLNDSQNLSLSLSPSLSILPFSLTVLRTLKYTHSLKVEEKR